MTRTYETSPLVTRGLTRIGVPSSSTGGPMLNVCNTDAMKINAVDSAKYLPGQIL